MQTGMQEGLHAGMLEEMQAGMSAGNEGKIGCRYARRNMQVSSADQVRGARGGGGRWVAKVGSWSREIGGQVYRGRWLSQGYLWPSQERRMAK